MKYIVQDSQNNKLIMTVAEGKSLPQLPEGFTVLGLADELPTEMAEIELAKSKEDQIKAAYDSMNADIFAEMETVFGTKNPDSATAHHETWKMMKDAPAEFVGADFADEAAVLAFVNPKLASALTYAKSRLARIKQFQEERDAILNS